MSLKRGFTLIELLLVILIMGMMAAITVPFFVSSMKGNRLRAAARTVAAAGRYARSMAVLHQRPVVITFEVDGSAVVVDLASARGPVSDQEEAQAPNDYEVLYTEGEVDPAFGRTVLDAEPTIRIERTLDGVRITQVRGIDPTWSGAGASGTRDRVRVFYGSNGRCQPHEIVLEDDDESQLIVAVDVLGGTEIRER